MKAQNRISKYIKYRWKNLITLDKIRLLKLLEMFQYTSIYVVLTLIATIFLNKLVEKLFFSKKNNKKSNEDKSNEEKSNEDISNEEKSNEDISNEEKNPSRINTFMLFVKYTGILIIQTFIILVAIFYVRKVGLLIPSISHIIDPQFKHSTTLDFAINIAIFMIISQLLPHHTEFIDVVGHLYH